MTMYPWSTEEVIVHFSTMCGGWESDSFEGWVGVRNK